MMSITPMEIGSSRLGQPSTERGEKMTNEYGCIYNHDHRSAARLWLASHNQVFLGLCCQCWMFHRSVQKIYCAKLLRKWHVLHLQDRTSLCGSSLPKSHAILPLDALCIVIRWNEMNSDYQQNRRSSRPITATTIGRSSSTGSQYRPIMSDETTNEPEFSITSSRTRGFTWIDSRGPDSIYCCYDTWKTKAKGNVDFTQQLCTSSRNKPAWRCFTMIYWATQSSTTTSRLDRSYGLYALGLSY